MTLKNILLCVLALLLFSCNQPASDSLTYYNIGGKVHGTYYSITYGQSSSIEKELVTEEGLSSVFLKFDRSLSTFDSLSIISRINKNEDVELDSLFLTVFCKGMEVSKETKGAFDMTVAPLVNCWGFGFKKSESVTPELVDSILSFVGYEKVSLQDGKIEKMDKRIMLDASAIAKGYSCDVVAAYLRSLGVKNYKVEIGGELVCSGVNPKGNTWVIGITKPTDDNSVVEPELQGLVTMKDCGMATSGNYRQFYVKDGKRYSHTINPHTGYPVEHSLLSATVVSDNCMTADAYATSFMVMGLDSAMAYASRTPELAAYFIYATDNEKEPMAVTYTSSFEKYLLKK